MEEDIYQDRHALERDRKKERKMSVSGRSLFTIERLEAERATGKRDIQYKGNRKSNRSRRSYRFDD